jgi:sigma-B regulation protein RsbU (phosphoserine phosphatase)
MGAKEVSLPAEICEKQQTGDATILVNPLGCVELWAGNDLAHRHVELVGLEGDVLSVPCGAREGGDLYALFSCAGQREARIVLADCVGHGHEASRIAGHIHGLIHQHRNIPDNATLLAVLNDEFAPPGQASDAPLRLSTVIVATFDRQTGEFNFAYAAHPRMLLWRGRLRRWITLDGLEGLPIGAFAGSAYTQQSVRLDPADIILMFSDGATDVFSPDQEMLTAEGLLELASTTLEGFPAKLPLPLFVEALVKRIKDFHGKDDLEDDLTLMTLRRSSLTSKSR